jgi:hypothetical protein
VAGLANHYDLVVSAASSPESGSGERAMAAVIQEHAVIIISKLNILKLNDTYCAMYTYSNLPDRTVRLLRLRQGQYEDPLWGDLSDVSLNDFPPYEALSYLWGPSNFTAQIHITWFKAHLMITESLAAGLRQFRHENKDRYLWIDQICINQQDLDERSAQVKFMGEIYERAACVLLWLGEDVSNNAPLANTIVHDIAQMRTMTANMRREERLSQYSLGNWAHTSGEPSITPFLDTSSTMTGEGAAMKQLTELPYWGRAWIL